MTFKVPLSATGARATFALTGCTIPATFRALAIAVRPASGYPVHSFDMRVVGALPGEQPLSTAPFTPGALALTYGAFLRVTNAGGTPVSTAMPALQLIVA